MHKLDIILNILIDIAPVLGGMATSFFIQGEVYNEMTIRRAILAAVVSVITGVILGNYLTNCFTLNVNGEGVLKWFVTSYAFDILEAGKKLMEYIKDNPGGLIERYLPKKQNKDEQEN